MSSDYSPTTFGETKNTLGSFSPVGLTHPSLDHGQICEFIAEYLLEAGYVIRYDEARARQILDGRKR